MIKCYADFINNDFRTTFILSSNHYIMIIMNVPELMSSKKGDIAELSLYCVVMPNPLMFLDTCTESRFCPRSIEQNLVNKPYK